MMRLVGQATGIAVLGTFWAHRVAARGGDASVPAQSAALHDTFLAMAGISAVALVLITLRMARFARVAAGPS